MKATATAEAARDAARGAAHAVGGNGTARAMARAGFVARAGFYLVLAYLAVRVVVEPGPTGRQANSHGALEVVSQGWPGKAAIAAAGLGFLLLGLVRIAGAVRDHGAAARQRLLTAAQGIFYVGLTYVPWSFLSGQPEHRLGAVRSSRRPPRSWAWPGGRVLLVVARADLPRHQRLPDQDRADAGLHRGHGPARAPRWVGWLVRGAGTVGIAARALVFVPVAVFLVVFAVQSDPRQSVGLDQEVATLARQSWWGPAVLAAVALGLVVFAVYSVLEARYRRVSKSR